MIKIYNTKSGMIEEFIPIRENEVSMYVCGPTVYDHAHIGNARPIIVFDTLRRLFEAEGYKVKFASNFTDVDDKIINRAEKECCSESTITSCYIDAYEDLRKSLNTIKLDAQPKVTETMDDIINFIKGLVDSGHAYEVDGDVYFRVESISNYGQISHQKIDDLLVGARIEENSKKENQLDFTLWKKTDHGISWDSPFSVGRPGWHTECVVMINNVFDGTIDIHGGGMDLRFPHHENEAAQAEACHHHVLANYWMHNGMINMDGEKMSKSLGNVKWAKDVVAELGSDVVRWLMMSVHYRGELTFSDETIEAAKTELTRVKTAIKQADLKLALADVDYTDVVSEYYNKFLECLNDDMNTPNGYAIIFETTKELNQALRNKEIDYHKVNELVISLRKMLNILGIDFAKLTLNEEDKEIYQKWVSAKQNKDFETADKLRAELAQRGITV